MSASTDEALADVIDWELIMFGLTVGLLALVGVVSVAIWRAQRGMFLVQYLFFLRYPIVFGLALALGPLIAVRQDMVGKLFVLDAVGIAIVLAFGAAFGSSSAKLPAKVPSKDTKP